MKISVFLFGLIAIANCSLEQMQVQVDLVKNLLANFNIKADDIGELRNTTGDMIDVTVQEFGLLSNLATTSISTSLTNIQQNVGVIRDYATNRTTALLSSLWDEVQNSQIYDIDYSKCLITTSFVNSLPDGFSSRLELSLSTAVWAANESVRQDALVMQKNIVTLTALKPNLADCSTNECVLLISEQAVRLNTEFIKHYNDLLVKIVSLPRETVQQATSLANSTIYEDEEYVCDNIKLIKICIDNHNDDEAVIGENTPNPDENTTPSPTINCNHKPFEPSLIY